MSDSVLSDESILDDIAHRFLIESEQGKTPDFEAYLREYPNHAEQLREIFSGFEILAGTSNKSKETIGGITKPGTLIDGKFKLIEPIGAGGMGQVWLSQQVVGLKRLVAIKLIKAGMDSERVLARFDAERQALAIMNHPNIATVFDAGVTEQGRPYFAMEYVKGVPIIQYCDSNCLSINERLKLFSVVCDAVLHSHQKGIIHRDLKPSNILICLFDGVPVPKVIDFGLAKAMDQSLTDVSFHTGHKEFVGTLLYTSPEQAEFNNVVIDIRSDVYSLGVVLYELLVGTTPLEKTRLEEIAETEALRQIREVDPQRPSVRYSGSGGYEGIAKQRLIAPNELKSTLQRELDWIVMCALEKDRSRRYQSASDFKEDIDRFLKGQPLFARPPSSLYRISKFVKRHRGYAGSALAVLVGIVSLLAWMSFDLYQRRALERRVNIGQVEYLRAAEARSFSQRLSELRGIDHSSFVSRLNDFLLWKPATTEKEKRRDSLTRMALLGQIPESSFDRDLEYGIEADEILAISPTLRGLAPNDRSALKKLLCERLQKNSDSSSPSYLRLIGVLCQIDSEHVRDSESLNEVSSMLCDLSSIELASWREVFQPLSEELVERLLQIIVDEDAGQQRRINAASLWVGFRSGQLEAIVEKGLEAPSIAFEPFLVHWLANPNESIKLLRRHLASKPTDDVSASQFVKSAIGLASLGDAERLWECFSGSLGEAVRAGAITQCHRRAIPFELLANRTSDTKSAMELASLIAAIGNYPLDKLRKGVNETLIESLKREYQSNPSSSVHGACESVLVRWKVPLPSIEVSSIAPSEDFRSFRSLEGIDMITMKVPQHVTDADSSPRSGYRVAVGAKEVTVAQFRKFLDEDVFKIGLEKFNYKVEISPTGDCPQNQVNWYLGAMFCNWLSLKEGISEDQWCFEVEASEEAMYRLKENAMYLSGYRFPSETEARIFCSGVNPPFDQPRSDSVLVMSNFPWGNESKLLNEFAFTAQNAMGRTWPAGHRLPNDLGLHDTLGSLLEWTVSVDKEASTAVCTGGNYINAQPELFYIEPNSTAGFIYRNFYFGFRVARTLNVDQLQID